MKNISFTHYMSPQILVKLPRCRQLCCFDYNVMDKHRMLGNVFRVNLFFLPTELHAVNSVPIVPTRNQPCSSSIYKQRLSHIPSGIYGMNKSNDCHRCWDATFLCISLFLFIIMIKFIVKLTPYAVISHIQTDRQLTSGMHIVKG